MLQNAGPDFILFLYALNFGTKLKCLIYFGDLFILTVENSRVPASWELTMHGFSLHSIRIQSLSLSVLLSRNMKQSLIETVDFRMISFNFDPMIEWRKKNKNLTHTFAISHSFFPADRMCIQTYTNIGPCVNGTRNQHQQQHHAHIKVKYNR